MQIGKLNYICTPSADVVELVDTLDLGFIQIKSVNLHFMRVWWNW